MGFFMDIIFFSNNQHKAREIEQILIDFKVRLYSEFVEPFEVVECGATFAKNAQIKLLALKERLQSVNYDNFDSTILMAEDSGLCVESLENMPSIFSARFASMPDLQTLNIAKSQNLASQNIAESLQFAESPQFAESLQNIKDSSDSANISRVINELKNRNLAESKAVFISCVACLCDFKGDFNKADSSDFKKGDSTIGDFMQNDSANNGRFLTTHGFLSGKVISEIKGVNGFGYDPIFVPCGFKQTLGEISPQDKNALSHRKNALDLMKLLLK